MSTTARIDGRRVVDHDINGAPILEGKELPLPRYDIPTPEAIKSCVWWLFGPPSQRRTEVVVTMGAVTAKPDCWSASEVSA